MAWLTARKRRLGSSARTHMGWGCMSNRSLYCCSDSRNCAATWRRRNMAPRLWARICKCARCRGLKLSVRLEVALSVPTTVSSHTSGAASTDRTCWRRGSSPRFQPWAAVSLHSTGLPWLSSGHNRLLCRGNALPGVRTSCPTAAWATSRSPSSSSSKAPSAWQMSRAVCATCCSTSGRPSSREEMRCCTRTRSACTWASWASSWATSLRSLMSAMPPTMRRAWPWASRITKPRSSIQR